jgi:hypothetical protein
MPKGIELSKMKYTRKIILINRANTLFMKIFSMSWRALGSL